MWQFRGNEWKLPRFCQQPLGNSASSPIGWQQVFGYFSDAVQQPLRAFPSGCRLKQGNFQIFFLKGRISVCICKKSNEHLKILKTTSGSSSSTDLSNNIIFSQSQSRATVGNLSSLPASGFFIYCNIFADIFHYSLRKICQDICQFLARCATLSPNSYFLLKSQN
jgi:hypothetical protein